MIRSFVVSGSLGIEITFISGGGDGGGALIIPTSSCTELIVIVSPVKDCNSSMKSELEAYSIISEISNVSYKRLPVEADACDRILNCIQYNSLPSS